VPEATPAVEDLLNWIQKQWEALIHRGELVRFKKGQIIFYENHKPIGLYLLHKGKISLTVNNGREVIQKLSDKGKPVLGLDFILTNIPYPYSANALEDSELYYITKTDFNEILQQDYCCKGE